MLDRKSLRLPTTWKKGKTIFVNSMSDLFYDDVPLEFIREVFGSPGSHSSAYLSVSLTKRAERVESLSSELVWSSNIWLGVSVENEDFAWCIHRLRHTGAAVKFLNLEPLLGPLDNLISSQALIGPSPVVKVARARGRWMLNGLYSIQDQCNAANVAFHFKQWGGVNKKKTGRVLDGRTWGPGPRPPNPSLKDVRISLIERRSAKGSSAHFASLRRMKPQCQIDNLIAVLFTHSS